jgi:hypothetical protein
MKTRKLTILFLLGSGLFQAQSCVLAMPPKHIIQTMLNPWCHKTRTTIEAIEDKFTDKEEGSYQFIVEIGGASNESFNDDYATSLQMEAKALLGLLCLACKHTDVPGMKNALRKGISVLEFKQDVKGKLSPEELNYLQEILSDSEESSSSSSSSSGSAMEIEPEPSDY